MQGSFKLLKLNRNPLNPYGVEQAGKGISRRHIKSSTQRRSGASQHMTKTSIILICVYIILIACVYIQQFNFVQ